MNPETPGAKEHVKQPAGFNLPVFDRPQLENVTGKLTWDEVTAEFESMRTLYLKRYGSDDKRLQNRNPLPFRL